MQVQITALVLPQCEHWAFVSHPPLSTSQLSKITQDILLFELESHLDYLDIQLFHLYQYLCNQSCMCTPLHMTFYHEDETDGGVTFDLV